MNCVYLQKPLINNYLKATREKEEKQNNAKTKKHSIYRWERASKKSFEMVKERLKRPIR